MGREAAARVGRERFVFGGGVVFPIATLSVLLIYTFMLERSLAARAEPPAARIAVDIRVLTGGHARVRQMACRWEVPKGL